MGGFAFRPMPSDDMVKARGDEHAPGSGICAVDEDLIVDVVRLTAVGYFDEPKRRKPAVKRPPAYTLLAGYFCQCCGARDVGVEGFEVAGVGQISAGACS